MKERRTYRGVADLREAGTQAKAGTSASAAMRAFEAICSVAKSWGERVYFSMNMKAHIWLSMGIFWYIFASVWVFIWSRFHLGIWYEIGYEVWYFG